MELQRIVKLTFQEKHTEDFERYFTEIKDKVAGQPGCKGVKLLKEKKGSGVYFTYSTWESEEDLNRYRETPLFGSVWPTVKAWFSDKPEAWSTEII